MKSKYKIWIIAAIGLVALLLLNYKIMPYWALVHSPSRIDGVYHEFVTTTAQTAFIPAVDAIFMGWKSCFMILTPLASILFGLGYYFGSIVGEDEIKQAADERVNEILSEKRVTTTGVIIQGFKAEEIEQTLRREYRKLSDEQKKLQYAREMFYEESTQFAKFVNKVGQAALSPRRTTLDHSGRPSESVPEHSRKTASNIIVSNRSVITHESKNKRREADHVKS